jgi:CBS domain-containing protein
MPRTPVPPPLIHLSLLLGSALRSPDGSLIGEVIDLTAALADDRAPISGAIIRIDGRDAYIPTVELASIDDDGLHLEPTPAAGPSSFEPPEHALRLAKHVLDHKLIDIRTRRVIRANEVEIMHIDDGWEVVGVDTGLRAFARRVLPRALARTLPGKGFLDWRDLEPLAPHLPDRAGQRLQHLHPAELADLVEACARDEGEELIDTLDRDPDRRADLFEELDADRAAQMLRARGDAEIADIATRAEPDAAADLLHTLPDRRRRAVLALLPPLVRRELRQLLDYSPRTAGGLMTPQFICLYRTATKTDALRRIERSRLPAHLLETVYLMNEQRRLCGALTLVDLLRTPEDEPLRNVARLLPITVRVEADLEELARVMADYNLTSTPVVNERDEMIGLVTIDDVLASLLPHRRRGPFDSFPV